MTTRLLTLVINYLTSDNSHCLIARSFSLVVGHIHFYRAFSIGLDNDNYVSSHLCCKFENDAFGLGVVETKSA